MVIKFQHEFWWGCSNPFFILPRIKFRVEGIYNEFQFQMCTAIERPRKLLASLRPHPGQAVERGWLRNHRCQQLLPRFDPGSAGFPAAGIEVRMPQSCSPAPPGSWQSWGQRIDHSRQMDQWPSGSRHTGNSREQPVLHFLEKSQLRQALTPAEWVAQPEHHSTARFVLSYSSRSDLTNFAGF